MSMWDIFKSHRLTIVNKNTLFGKSQKHFKFIQKNMFIVKNENSLIARITSHNI